MLRFLVLVLFCTLFAGQVLADVPESVTLRARKGNIAFPHKKHTDNGFLKDCTVCHDKERGFKLGKQGMVSGHTMCRNCHTENGVGPRDCDGCHR